MTHRLSMYTAIAAALAATVGPAGATDRWTEQLTRDSGGWSIAHYPREVIDVNGDGLADLVAFGHKRIYAAISSGVGFNRGVIWSSQFTAVGGGWNTADYHRTLGDVNGDGRADVVAFGYSATYVALSDGGRFANGYIATRDFDYGSGWRPSAHDRRVGDVDGDGRADVVGFNDDGVFVGLSNGHGFGPAARWSGPAPTPGGFERARNTRLLADIDGDGRADVVAFHRDGVSVMRSTGAGFAAAELVLADMGYNQRGTIARAPRAVADVDGDGRADLVAMVDEGVLVARSTGQGFEAPAIRLAAFGEDHGWDDLHLRVMGDIDGNGQADVIGFAHDAVRVALAEGERFETHFTPLTGGDFATRLQRYTGGLCLSTSGAHAVQMPCDDDTPLGWILRARSGATYDVMQDGKCLRVAGADSTEARAEACGADEAAWFVERSREGLARLRSADDGRCLGVLDGAGDEGDRLRAVGCDASDALLWYAATLRPRAMVSSLRASDGTCLTASSSLFGSARPAACTGSAAQTFTLTDDGHGAFRIRSHQGDLCLMPGVDPVFGATVVSWPCAALPPEQTFALRQLEDGSRLLVAQDDGRCVDIESLGVLGRRVSLGECDGAGHQRWVMPEMQAMAAMDISLQGVGGSGDTTLVIGGGEAAFVTDDPLAIVAVARRIGLLTSRAVYEALLSTPQQAEFEARVFAWDAPLPDPVQVRIEVLSVSARYDVGLDGVDMELDAAVASRTIEIGGVVHNEGRLLSAEAQLMVYEDGFAIGPSVDVIAVESGFGDPDGSYAGIGGGIGSRGISVGASWGHDGRYGATVPLGVVAVDLYVAGDDVITAAAFARDVGGWVGSATVDAFSSAWSWSAGAFDTATDAIGDFAGDVGHAIGGVIDDAGDVFCGIFGC